MPLQEVKRKSEKIKHCHILFKLLILFTIYVVKIPTKEISLMEKGLNCHPTTSILMTNGSCFFYWKLKLKEYFYLKNSDQSNKRYSLLAERSKIKPSKKPQTLEVYFLNQNRNNKYFRETDFTRNQSLHTEKEALKTCNQITT